MIIISKLYYIMSDLFLKYGSKPLDSESSINLTGILNGTSKDRNSDVTSSVMPYMNASELSATSLYSQNGGIGSITSSNVSGINTSDINNLLSMLSSDTAVSETNLHNKLNNLLQNGGGDSTETEQLESNIKNMLGGGPLTSSLITLAGLGVAGALSEKYLNSDDQPGKILSSVLSRGYNKISSQYKRPIRNSIQREAYLVSDTSVNSVPQDMNFSETSNVSNIFLRNRSKNNLDNGFNTTTTVNNNSVTSSAMPPLNSNQTLSATSSAMPVNSKLSATSSAMPLSSNQNLSATSSAMPFMEDLVGGNNPALVAFRGLINLVTKILGVNHPKGMKIASHLQKDIKKENPKIAHEDLVSAGKKLLLANKSKYLNLKI